MNQKKNSFQSTIDNFTKKQTITPKRIIINPKNIETGDLMREEFDPKKHYFQISINDIYLKYSRRWFREYVPLVIVISEFKFKGKQVIIPFITGPTNFKDLVGEDITEGMKFSNTQVVSLRPYNGGRIKLTVLLCKVVKRDYLKEILGFLEKTSDLVSLAGISSYLEVAQAMLEGVQSVLDSGKASPIASIHEEFDSATGVDFLPNYFALLEPIETKINKEKLYVRDSDLVYGENKEKAKPFRETSFVLYSITQTDKREDLDSLPFYPLYEKTKQYAMIPIQNVWDLTKFYLSDLQRTILLSPNLTPNQRISLADDIKDEIYTIHKKYAGKSDLGPEARKFKPDDIEKRILEILKL